VDLLERARLLEELDGELAATATGGRVALVAGEAGIGKSALVRRFTERHAAGARILVGTCDPLLTPRALGPLHDYNRSDVFRLVVDDRPKPHLVSLAQARGGPAG
jgi:predicted ATPase